MITKRHIPNLLTVARVLAVPLALLLMAVGSFHVVLFWIFVLAALSDFLDGYLARKWNVISAFGVMLDPVADKLLVALMLLYLLHESALPLLPVAIILLREIYVSGLRDFLGSRGVELPVSSGGKWKTALQLLAIACLLGSRAYEITVAWDIGMAALWAAVVLTCTSAARYTRSVWAHLSSA